jgi:two-component system sensor histidine kinase KdpD
MNARQQLRVSGLALLAVAIITLCATLLRDTLTLANFTMIYLLLVVIVAIEAGTAPAFVTTFASFMCINFFLIPPYYSLLVADPREVLDLAVFLMVAVMAGRLAANARLQTQEAHQRAREQEILYQLTRSFNQLTQAQGVYDALTRVLREDLAATQAQILPHTDAALAGDSTVYYLLLQGGERIYGTVRAAFPTPLAELQKQLLHTCVGQAAMALQRIDLTERASRSRQFEEADKLKTAILHAVSHDLRTPITIIKTSASNLRQFQQQLTDEEQADIAATIEHEVDQLDQLVGNLLDLSRLQAGTLTLSRQLNSLEEVAGDVAARVWQLTRQERIKIIFPEDMPLVSFDYGLVLQAVSNLVDNSLRYEPAESCVEIRGLFTDAGAVLKVVNHGETISAEVKARMMEPFFHGRGGRTGLGLPIARGIIEAHEGHLSVEDTPGGGATFVIDLPHTEAQKHEAQNTGGG